HCSVVIRFVRSFPTRRSSDLAGVGGSPIASLLLGYPTQITRATLFGTFGLRGWEHSAYVQDDFKMTRRLTLNLGLRYELFLPLTDRKSTRLNSSHLGISYAVF